MKKVLGAMPCGFHLTSKMKRGMREVILFSLIGAILAIGFVSGSFTRGVPAYSIEKQYSLGDFVTGWVNLSFSEEPSNSTFNTSLGDKISLINLIKLNTPGFSYSCNPSNCLDYYSALAGSDRTTKSFSLTNGSESILGFEIRGPRFQSVSDFSMNLESSAGESEHSQLIIDILNDNEIDWQSHTSSGNFKAKDYGCYNVPNDASSPSPITSNAYCGKITIPATTSAKIGANVTSSATPPTSVTFEMSANEVGGSAYGNCEAVAAASGEIECTVSLNTTEEKDFHVCIKVKAPADNQEYKINFERNAVCGFSEPFTSYSIDFQIFARASNYSSVGSLTLNNNEINIFNSEIGSIETSVINYIYQKYNDNCTAGCFIPIKFISRKNQTIDITSFNINFQTDVPGSVTKLFNATKTPAKINSGFQKLSLNKANFSVPDEFGEKIFKLNFNSAEIMSESISIKKIPKILSLNTYTAMAAYPTEFSVNVKAFDYNITIYEWDFGTGEKATTEINKVTYTYPNLGTYNLTVKVTTNNSLTSSKIFEISATSPKDAVSSVLSRKLSYLNAITLQMDEFSQFYQDSIREILNLTETEDKLAELELANASAISDQDYVDIMTELALIKVPQQIIKSRKADAVLFYPGREEIDMDVIKEIGGGNYGNKKEEYIDAVLGWDLDNVESEMDFEELSAIYEESEEQLLSVFTFKISLTSEPESDSYFIIKKMENLNFMEDYSEAETSNYVYIPLSDSETTITLSTAEDVDFNNIPAFISPKISELSVVNIQFAPADIAKSMVIFIAMLSGLALLTLIVYIILQRWYKTKYESYLFKNRNDLYNLGAYINGSKRRGIGDKEIASQLRKAGWKQEQVRYAIRRYYGKKTGMFEIPFKESFGVFRKKENFQQQNFYQQRDTADYS